MQNANKTNLILAATPNSLGRRAGLSGQQIRNLIAKGRITAFFDATHRYIILESEAQRFIAERAAQGPIRRGGRKKKAATP